MSRVREFDYKKYFGASQETKEELRALQERIATVEAKVAAEVKGDVQALKNTVAEVETKVAAEVSALAAATTAALSHSAAPAKKEVTITTSQDAAIAETAGADLGQARPEDLETYTTRR